MEIFADVSSREIVNISDNVRSLQAQLDITAGFCNKMGMKINIITAQLISAFVFATQIVQYLFYFNSRCQASSLLL